MQGVKKLVQMSTRIEPEMATPLHKFEPPHQLCEFCIVGKQYSTPSRIVNRRNPFKCAIAKGELFHGDIVGGSKIVRTLGRARYVFTFFLRVLILTINLNLIIFKDINK